MSVLTESGEVVSGKEVDVDWIPIYGKEFQNIEKVLTIRYFTLRHPKIIHVIFPLLHDISKEMASKSIGKHTIICNTERFKSWMSHGAKGRVSPLP